MADYRLPMDADGVKYHGTVDQNEENPGQFMYGLDENGNKRIIRTDENGNVLTRLTGSIVELFNDEVEVSAGAFVGVTPNFENKGYREAWCTCIADKGHSFQLRLQMREGHYNMFQFTDDNDISSLPIGDNLKSVLPKLFITSHI